MRILDISGYTAPQDKKSPTPQWVMRFMVGDAGALTFLIVAGFIYYGLYYNYGFNIADEGSVLLLTKRLLEGERPFIDVDLGYGLLWYYPLVLMFKVTGVSFIATRIFFLALAMVTSILAFITMRRHTRRRWLAVGFALLVLFIPGTIHKTFLPLIVVANMLFLPSMGSNKGALGSKEVFAAGLVTAVSYQIRPDVGLCTSLVLIVSLGMYAISHSRSWSQQIASLANLLLNFGSGALVPTLPLTLIALRQGFLKPYKSMLYQPMETLINFIKDLVPTSAYAQAAAAEPKREAISEFAAQVGRNLARAPLAAAWEGGSEQVFALLTYLPLLTPAIIAAFVLFLMPRSRIRPRTTRRGDAVEMFALLGFAYSCFPQFFGFRPDVNHLSQFMPGYTVLVGVFLVKFLFPDRDVVSSRRDLSTKRLIWLLCRSGAAGILILHVGIYSWFGVRQPATGSVAVIDQRTERFIGANGIDVIVTQQEKKFFTDVVRIVEENTSESDDILCFPYCPGFVVMSNRNTFLRKLYVDDSLLVIDPGWQRRIIHQMETEQPALIIIQDWAVNGTEISRFQNWATKVMKYISSEYDMVESLGVFKFYAPHNDGLSTRPEG